MQRKVLFILQTLMMIAGESTPGKGKRAKKVTVADEAEEAEEETEVKPEGDVDSGGDLIN